MGTRVIKASPNAQAGIVVAKNVVRANVGEDNGMLVDEKGITFTGPLSFVSSPNHIRIGGLWTLQSSMRGSLPSTLATPSPMYVIDPPIKQVVGLVAECAVMLGLLGMTAIGAV